MLLKEYGYMAMPLCLNKLATNGPAKSFSVLNYPFYKIDQFEPYQPQRPDMFYILTQLCTCPVTSSSRDAVTEWFPATNNHWLNHRITSWEG